MPVRRMNFDVVGGYDNESVGRAGVDGAAMGRRETDTKGKWLIYPRSWSTLVTRPVPDVHI